jgi:preprotein translocase subunit SecA
VSSLNVRPGAAFGVYPERERVHPGWLQQSVDRASLLVGNGLFSGAGKRSRIVADIYRQGDVFSNEQIAGLRAQAAQLRRKFATEGQSDALATASFALAREAVQRQLNVRLFDEQLMAGWVMFKGGLAEMAPGEGKTLAALLPACTAALAGIPVHVISTTDRLAKRNAGLLRSVYEALGISVGLIEAGTPIGERRAAYQCDITYCSSKQLAFDYLQDRLLLNRQSGILQLQVDRLNKAGAVADQLRLRGLCYAIIDDADSILIDDSLSPLILTRSGRSTRSAEDVESDVLARTSFPRFFQRYLKLSGAASNLRELSQEMHATYGLRVHQIVARKPSLRRIATDQIFVDHSSKWQAICDSAKAMHNNGQPVLVITRSAEDSAQLGQLLTVAGVPHQLADASKNDDSLRVLANAGQRGAVTLSSIALAQGTDIVVDEQARELGGLHVILSERHAAARIDDRFMAYSARRGESGSAVAMLSLEDALAQEFLPAWMRTILQRGQLKGAGQCLRLAQKKQQRLTARARQQSLTADRQLDELLAFSGTAL